jgi:hypothetical protein
VNTYTVGDQRAPSIAMDGSGNFVVAWSSAGQDGSVTGVYAQRFSATDCVLPARRRRPTRRHAKGARRFFSVTPSGLGPFTYQWRKNGVNLSEGGKVYGSDARTLKITTLTAADATTYSAVVSDYCLPPASTTSGSATLTVNAGQHQEQSRTCVSDASTAGQVYFSHGITRLTPQTTSCTKTLRPTAISSHRPAHPRAGQLGSRRHFRREASSTSSRDRNATCGVGPVN